MAMTMKFVFIAFVAFILPFYLVKCNLDGICDICGFIANKTTSPDKVAHINASISTDVLVCCASIQ